MTVNPEQTSLKLEYYKVPLEPITLPKIPSNITHLYVSFKHIDNITSFDNVEYLSLWCCDLNTPIPYSEGLRVNLQYCKVRVNNPIWDGNHMSVADMQSNIVAEHNTGDCSICGTPTTIIVEVVYDNQDALVGGGIYLGEGKYISSPLYCKKRVYMCLSD